MMETSIFRIPSSSRLLLLSAICSLANSFPHSGPNPTVSYKVADWSPRPTHVPRPRLNILRRDNSNASICGWAGGDVHQPLACPSDANCVFDTSHGMVGCCPQNGPCTTGVYTNCVEQAQGAQNPSILTCSGGSVCYENAFPGGYYQYACGTSAVTNTIATSYSGQNWQSQLQVIYTQLTLATTQSASSTASSTVSSTSNTASSSSSASTQSSTTSLNTLPTTTSASDVTTSAQSVASTSAAAVTADEFDPQTKAGIIAGSAVGGLSVIFALLALGCGLMRRRQRKQVEERARSIIVPKDKTLSMNSYASSQLSGQTRIHPFSPDDVISPMTPPHQPQRSSLETEEIAELLQEVQPAAEHDEPYIGQHQFFDIPNPQPLSKVEEPYVRRVQLFDRPSIDELADLPPPWVRPPTPPPRSPKRLTMKILPSDDQTPLEVYLQSKLLPVLPSTSVKSGISDTSRYSRTTDGRSIISIKESKNGQWKDEEIPPMPVTRKPVGSGWYRTMAPLTEKKSGGHVALQLSSNEDIGRSLTSTQQTLEKSISEPVHDSVTEEALERYAGMSATINNVQELDIRGMASDWVAPLRLSAGASQSVTVKKQRRSPVPILGIPAAPPPGERGSRLYDVR